MASPVDTFKNNLFGQLKSYGDVVQGVFEQRIGKFLYCVLDLFTRDNIIYKQAISPILSFSFNVNILSIFVF
jgi:hypothetical protein